MLPNIEHFADVLLKKIDDAPRNQWRPHIVAALDAIVKIAQKPREDTVLPQKVLQEDAAMIKGYAIMDKIAKLLGESEGNISAVWRYPYGSTVKQLVIEEETNG